MGDQQQQHDVSITDNTSRRRHANTKKEHTGLRMRASK
jgi:hypothetical protein